MPTVLKVNCQNGGRYNSRIKPPGNTTLTNVLVSSDSVLGVGGEHFRSAGVLEKCPHVSFAVSDAVGFIA